MGAIETVTTNLFGDILSDQMAGLVGGLGMAPGASWSCGARRSDTPVHRKGFSGRQRATPDLGGKASTLEFSQVITNRVAA
jgi:isocitrate dehydrogenase (NAD+)